MVGFELVVSFHAKSKGTTISQPILGGIRAFSGLATKAVNPPHGGCLLPFTLQLVAVPDAGNLFRVDDPEDA